MVFGKKSNKGTDYDIAVGEKKLKSIIGGQLVRNRDFYKKMTMKGIINTPGAWHKINSQIRKELKEGTLYPDDIEKRIDELIEEISSNSRGMSDESKKIQLDNLKHKILRNGHVSIFIPYQKSGVNDAIIGGAFLGEWGAVLGSLNEGNTSWKATALLFIEDGITVKSTGHIILYEDIKKVILAQKAMLFSIVSVITKSGENFVYRTGHENAQASMSIIEDNMQKFIPQATVGNALNKSNDDADILLKYAELYEKGLLTKEEFEMKKAEIFNNVPDVQSDSLNSVFIENQENESEVHFCPNCGEKVDGGTNFCTNCGAKLV